MSCQVQLWPARIVTYLNHHRIEFPDNDTFEDISEIVQTFTDAKVKYDKFRKAGEDRWGFKTAYNKLVRDFPARSVSLFQDTIGGDTHNITKMSKEKRIQASFDKKDPLEEMEMPSP